VPSPMALFRPRQHVVVSALPVALLMVLALIEGPYAWRQVRPALWNQDGGDHRG